MNATTMEICEAVLGFPVSKNISLLLTLESMAILFLLTMILMGPIQKEGDKEAITDNKT